MNSKNPRQPNLLAIHRHKFGTTVFPFYSKLTPLHLLEKYKDDNFCCYPNAEFCQQLGIDFEPDKDEDIEIVELDRDEHIPTIE